MEVGVFSILGLWCLARLMAPAFVTIRLKEAWLVLVLLLFWLGYLLIQVAPIPITWLSMLSPSTADLYNYTMDQSAGSRPISLDPGSTLVEFLKSASYVALFFLVLVLVDSRSRLRFVAVALVAIGVAEAIFAIYSSITGISFSPDKLMDGHWNRLIGTFVNRNHFAAHLAMGVSVALGICISIPDIPRNDMNWSARLKALTLLSRRGALFLGMITMVLCLLLNGSRGANGALAVALVGVLFLAVAHRGVRTPEIRIAPWIVFIILLSSLYLISEGLLGKIVDDNYLNERILQWTLTLRLLENYPLFGVGAGNYVSAFPLYQDASLGTVVYNHAHNDYLELLVDQGIAGFILLGLAIILMFIRLIQAYRRRRDLLARGMLFASLVGMSAMLVHSVVEFNFHIPANAAYFFVLAGIGFSASTLRSINRKQTQTMSYAH